MSKNSCVIYAPVDTLSGYGSRSRDTVKSIIECVVHDHIYSDYQINNHMRIILTTLFVIAWLLLGHYVARQLVLGTEFLTALGRAGLALIWIWAIS